MNEVHVTAPLCSLHPGAILYNVKEFYPEKVRYYEEGTFISCTFYNTLAHTY